MSDIVSLLRERPYRLASESNTEMQGRRQSEREYAAHEIEVLRLEKARLAAENDRLRAALEEIDSISVHSGGDIHGIHPSFWEVAFKQAQDVTRAALEGK